MGVWSEVRLILITGGGEIVRNEVRMVECGTKRDRGGIMSEARLWWMAMDSSSWDGRMSARNHSNGVMDKKI